MQYPAGRIFHALLTAEGYADVIVSDIENRKVVDIEALPERSGCDGQEEKAPEV